MRACVSILIFFSLIYCAPPKAPNRFSDPVFVRLAELQDQRNTDSLLVYLRHPEAQYRQQACMAFGSVQDSLASSALGSLLLEDIDQSVRAAAAFALGQTKGTQAVNALLPALSDTAPRVRREVLEALGKSISKEDFSLLHSFQPRDSLDEDGMAWALYRIGLRGLADTTVVRKAAALFASTTLISAQLGLAHFFSRANYPLLPEVFAALVKGTSVPQADIRMAAVYALRKFPTEDALKTIQSLLISDPDYRVRTNAARTLRFFPWASAQGLFEKALQYPQVNVAIAAAEAVRSVSSKENHDTLLAWARNAKNGRVQALLYESVLQTNASDETTNEIIAAYNNASDSYHKAWLLQALAQSAKAIPFLQDVLRQATVNIIKTTAAASLVAIDQRAGKVSPSQRKENFQFYREVLLTGDVGIIVSVCEALKDPALGYKDVIEDANFLQDVKAKLSLPRDFEAMVPLEETIAYLEGRSYTPPPKTFNHPIQWDSVRAIPADQRVKLETTKGVIEIQLLVEEAPGSVLNFLQLAKSHYFDGVFAHRVVPNFVVQAGCHRGDGLGSEDYSIRSEFSARRYKTGSVGMASAGKDTEGTQWFITHSPTPHLDGGYTIFAEVTSGQDVVDLLEVGDEIRMVTVLKK